MRLYRVTSLSLVSCPPCIGTDWSRIVLVLCVSSISKSNFHKTWLHQDRRRPNQTCQEHHIKRVILVEFAILWTLKYAEIPFKIRKVQNSKAMTTHKSTKEIISFLLLHWFCLEINLFPSSNLISLITSHYYNLWYFHHPSWSVWSHHIITIYESITQDCMHMHSFSFRKHMTRSYIDNETISNE